MDPELITLTQQVCSDGSVTVGIGFGNDDVVPPKSGGGVSSSLLTGYTELLIGSGRDRYGQLENGANVLHGQVSLSFSSSFLCSYHLPSPPLPLSPSPPLPPLFLTHLSDDFSGYSQGFISTRHPSTTSIRHEEMGCQKCQSLLPPSCQTQLMAPKF